ncbi:MAG: acyltransferase [Promethearchaeota archaeon]
MIRRGCVLRESRLDSHVNVGWNALLSRLTAGKNTQIEYGVLCTGHGDGRITIGKECYIGIRAVLDWSDSITIGNFVHIAGPAVGIWTHTSVKQALAGHRLSDKSLRETAPVVIRDNVYIGGHTIIYPGVTIGDHAVILPNSVVNEDVSSWTMVGGVPAKRIRKIDPEFLRQKNWDPVHSKNMTTCST